MKVNAKFKWNKSKAQIQQDKGFNRTLYLYTAKETKRLMSPYVPRRDGNLMNNVEYVVQADKGQVNYISPYASVMYYGDNLNFRKDANPKAMSRWERGLDKSVLAKAVNKKRKQLSK